jgi:hypothetical protein
MNATCFFITLPLAIIYLVKNELSQQNIIFLMELNPAWLENWYDWKNQFFIVWFPSKLQAVVRKYSNEFMNIGVDAKL